MTRDEVQEQFGAAPDDGGPSDRMADEIIRLRKQAETITSMLWEQVPLLNRLEDENVRLLATLAKLREPSAAVVHEAREAYIETPLGVGHWKVALRAAVAAAEKEVTSC